jgi:hypothetical protein
MKLQWLACMVLVLVCNLPAQTAQAQEKWDPCSLAHARTDVALTLTLKGGQSVYHEGETIPLELAFTSSAIAFLPKSGGAGSFCLSPEGHDPLQDYFFGFIPGASAAPSNFGPYQTLSAVPYVVREELNEWKSMPPGSYSLRVVNHAVAVASNDVRFQVLPASPEWQAEQLARALVVLDANHKQPTQAEIEQTEHAVRVLRFLGSEASTRELARRFWSHDQQRSPTSGVAYPSYGFYRYERSQSYWDFKAGLIGSPYRAVAIQELTAAINDPLHPATRAMVETLALLEIQSNPAYPKVSALRREPQGGMGEATACEGRSIQRSCRSAFEAAQLS